MLSAATRIRSRLSLVIFPAQLKTSACSILTLHTPVLANPKDPRQLRGIAVGDVIVETIDGAQIR